MLTKEDLQAIGELVRSEVRASEERMTARISESEERTKTSIMAYIENDVKKEIRQIADGHKMLAEKNGPDGNQNRQIAGSSGYNSG